MKLDANGDVIFSSGHRAYAHMGYIGLTAFGDVGNGFAGGYDDYNEVQSEGFSPEDCTELADHMIARWEAWRELHGTKP